jgi:hypothetical protein
MSKARNLDFHQASMASVHWRELVNRWKKLDDWEEKLSRMTVEELKKELSFWKARVQFFQPKVRKLARKRVHKAEGALNRKRSENQGIST